ncbi:hypothetical protein [Enterovibrio norvegicus]|uniref:hypothetical protein n=1 Tax=Enterovibrio norvegicus TaxID=188144 RepID=UPI0013D43D53|nr:hypothetical protein [Enterovibrio norvegicus]
MDNELSYEEILHLAAYAVNNGDLANALTLCKKIDIEATPDQRLNLIHAAILNQLGMHQESIDIYNIVVEKDPDNELAKFQLGVAYFFSNDIGNAETYWQGLDYFAHFAEGFLSAKSGDFEQAIKHLSLFIANNEQYPALNGDASNLLKAFEDKLARSSTEQEPSSGETLDTNERIDSEPSPNSTGSTETSQKNVSALLSIYKE